jgi:hypothetical protein
MLHQNKNIMKKLHFSIDIRAPKEEVWKALWEDSSYRKWTSVFSEGSYAVTDWNEGSKIFFLDSNQDGMSSIIAKKIPNERMSFRHMGVVQNGKEQPPDEEVKKWSGAIEEYTLRETGGATRLQVEMDSTDDHYEIFQEKFPKALEKLKEISEKTKATTEAV